MLSELPPAFKKGRREFETLFANMIFPGIGLQFLLSLYSPISIRSFAFDFQPFTNGFYLLENDSEYTARNESSFCFVYIEPESI
jgi:hypothetical protein